MQFWPSGWIFFRKPIKTKKFKQKSYWSRCASPDEANSSDNSTEGFLSKIRRVVKKSSEIQKLWRPFQKNVPQNPPQDRWVAFLTIVPNFPMQKHENVSVKIQNDFGQGNYSKIWNSSRNPLCAWKDFLKRKFSTPNPNSFNETELLREIKISRPNALWWPGMQFW